MKKRILYFDYLKLISSFLVVLIHIISEFWYQESVTSVNFTLLTILDSLCRCCVPIYFMISGALFLNEDKKITIKDIFTKYILKIFLIFLFWNIIYSLLKVVIITKNSLSLKIILDIISSTILGEGVFHLRFLVIIIGFYLCVPILRLITKKENKNIIEYLLLILFIFTSLNKTSANLFKINLSYPIMFGSYLLYFILGYYLYKYELNKKKTKTIYVIGIINLLLTIILTLITSNILNKPTEIFFDYLSFNVIFYSIFIFVLFKNKNYKTNKIVNVLSKNYFGIYLIHGLVLGFYQKLGLFNLNIPLLLIVILNTIVIYITSFISSYIISKIPIIKKVVLQ